MALRPALLSLATAVPPHVLTQKDIAKAARRVFGDKFGDFDKVEQVFETAGVVQRHAARPLEWYLEPHGWPDRTEVYLQSAADLFEEAARKALAGAGLSGADVDTVVTASSTGIATPSLDAYLLDRLGFREDVARVPLFGLGCAAGVTGLALAMRLAAASPGSTVLFVTVELSTLAVRPDKLTAANVVSTALFADGAAALVVRAGDGGFATAVGSGEHTWRDTLDIMGWDIDPDGFGVVLARALPPFAETHLGSAVAGILDRLGIQPSSIDRFVCHPGGPKIIAALEHVLRLEPGTLDHERDVLATHGNMSAPTVLFVLERVLRAGLPERCLLIAMGPGFTASCLALERRP
ncbi:type III polyketide synthase [Microvirga thermotolerans]|uniref:Type III polyketide synthase n=1 Tax=Microvirga thermotolerans TaxID=2651334 RepID=A0A5P9JXT5_9HYPH|nr:type III polyketide synthase [Microvirga thermotolerans]QFU17427.1 type III polyketide synthase [Microvirga thermotolerans]